MLENNTYQRSNNYRSAEVVYMGMGAVIAAWQPGITAVHTPTPSHPAYFANYRETLNKSTMGSASRHTRINCLLSKCLQLRLREG